MAKGALNTIVPSKPDEDMKKEEGGKKERERRKTEKYLSQRK